MYMSKYHCLFYTNYKLYAHTVQCILAVFRLNLQKCLNIRYP